MLSLLCMHVRLFMQSRVFYSVQALKFSLSMSVICREQDLCVRRRLFVCIQYEYTAFLAHFIQRHSLTAGGSLHGL